MNAPTTTATATAIAAARLADTEALRPVVSAGVVGVLVVYGPPSARLPPWTLRTRFGDALDRAFTLPAIHDAAASRFLGALPDTVSPVAALGLAVRDAVEDGARWVHNGTVEKASRWTYCAATVTAHAVSIHGNTCAEVSSDGTLTIDAGVPPTIAATLRASYTAARGLVEPSRVVAIVAAHLAREGGRSVSPSAYLLPSVSYATAGILAGLCDVGGFAVAYPVADAAQIAALAAPVVASVEDQIAAVVEKTREFVAKAAAAAAPDGGTLQERTGETVRASIAAARAAAALWRDRLSLAALDVDATLDDLDAAADAADKTALAAVAARRKEKTARSPAAL